LWSSATERDRTVGDLATQAYQGFPATVVGVTSAGPGDSIYVVKLLHARADSSATEVRPLALERVYALRTPGAPFGWQLSEASTRVTQNWERHRVGRLTFWYAPGRHPDAAKAAQAARFVDSVAAMLAVPAPSHLDMYLANSMDEAQRVLGLDFFVEQSGPGTGRGGRTLPSAGIILVGDPAIGESYRHELTHAVLSPRLAENALFTEGVATWLGGSLGRSPTAMYALLAGYQAAHPDVRMSDLVRGEVTSGWGQTETDALYATAALVVDGIYQRSGIPGLRSFARVKSANPDTLLEQVRTHLGLQASPSALERWWRERAVAR
jgi:hypothetical protein